jgi:phosphohistidine swiveling domain-containing protein
LNWEEYKKAVTIQSVEVLKDFSKLKEEYKTEMELYKYPTNIFLTSVALYWTTEQKKEVFGKTIPFALGFAKEGKGEWYWILYKLLGDMFFEQIENERESFIEEIRGKTQTLKENFESWLNKQSIEKDQSLKYYLDRIEETCQEFLNSVIHFEISAAVGDLLHKKLIELLKDEELILKLATDPTQSETFIHNQALKETVEWVKYNHLELSKELMDHEEFKEKLQDCWNKGYFLSSGYGGVKFSGLNDEFNELMNFKINESHESKKELNLKLNDEEKFWVETSKFFSILRDRRKTIQQKAFYHLALLLEEVSKMVGIPLEDLYYLRVDQITEESLTNKDKLKEIIKLQREGYFYCWTAETGKFYLESGKKAEELYLKYKPELMGIKEEVTGQVACPGIIKGKARIVLSMHQDYTFDEGDVLITAMTSPDFVPLMKKASAVVTDLGGVTCHAAIVSRELGVPCIIGTKVATEVFKDGDLVEVDADNGVVRKLSTTN